MYAEVLRTDGGGADLGYSFCDYLWALRVRDELDLATRCPWWKSSTVWAVYCPTL